MKKLKIIKEGLIEGDFFTCPLENLRGIKVSEEQARRYGFFEEDAYFEELVDKYGQENVLTTGEFYNGYCILSDVDCNYLICMQGSIEHLGNSDDLPNLALNNSKLYKLCYEQANKQEQTGFAKDVCSFGNAHFELVSACPKSTGDALREKLVEGSISGNPIEFSDEEYKIITEYFYNTQFTKIFEVLE